MELLSPAGNREALVAAIACGADAVYLGYTAFGARSYAGNFDEPGLCEAVAYAHERGKKIYVTVNTLVKQCEMDDLCDVLEIISRSNADAILVQDMGALKIARERFPQLTLHASTQMTVNNAQGARLMRSLGLTRVVPARECSLEELRLMADTGVEIEAFAHGALCVAVSGQCLFSSMIGGRSGNRGRCAQPCRLPYTLRDGENGYLLSTKDLMLIDRIPQLRDAGVYSFKLEGRMKRPEYVGVITRAYREALDCAQAHVPYHPDAKTIDDLRQVFNRGGFTEGYVMGQSHAALMSWTRPNHWGVPVGEVRSVRGRLAQVALERDLHDGDGLQLRGATEADMTYAGKDSPAGTIATVRMPLAGAKPGDAIFRLTDAMQMKEIREMMAQERACIALHAALYAMPDELPKLTIADEDGHSVEVLGDAPVARAQQRALDVESAKKQLSKMGGTPYVLASLSFESEQAFMTAGALNALRRDGLAALRTARTHAKPVQAEPMHMPVVRPAQEKLLIVQSGALDTAYDLLAAGADVFCWQPHSYLEDTLEKALADNPGATPALVLPAVTYSRELDRLHAFVCRHKEHFCAVVANNVGQLEPAWPVPVWGGQGLNVMNSACAGFYYALGATRLTASCELSAAELHEFCVQGGNFEIEAYGRTQLMLLSHCPMRTLRGDTARDSACNACQTRGGCPNEYTDRKGYRFPLMRMKMDGGCVVRVYNSVPTDMARHAQKLQRLGVSLRLAFTDETIQRQRELTASYRSILDGGRALHEIHDPATAGHLLRGIE